MERCQDGEPKSRVAVHGFTATNAFETNRILPEDGEWMYLLRGSREKGESWGNIIFSEGSMLRVSGEDASKVPG